MLTAQERKRQIRERRRSLQCQSVAAAAPACAAANSNGDNPTHNDSDRAAKARKIDSNLDENLNSQTNSYTNGSLSKASTGDGTIQLESNFLNEELFVGTASSTVASKSLFSAVMKRSFATPEEKKEGNADNGGSLLNKVMRGSDATSGESNNVTFSASTPTKSPSRRKVFDKANSPGRSPGGYAIKEALDGVSDFTQTFYNMKEDEKEEEDNVDDRKNQEEYRVATVITRTVPLYLTNNEVQIDGGNTNSLDVIIEETKMANSASMDTSFYHEPIGINVMDWSLKKRVRIVSSSGSLPGTFISVFSQNRRKYVPPNDGVVLQLAIQYVTNKSHNNALSDIHDKKPTLEESAMAKWTAATMYYQHPAVHPLPLSVLLENNGNGNCSPNGDLPNVSSFNNRVTYQRVRLSGMGCMGGLGMSDKLQKNILETNTNKMSSSGITSSLSNLLDKRICEWQEAFKSMYQCWRSKLALLAKQFSTAGGSKTFYDEISRCCFYSIAPTQIILFRFGWSSDDKIIPLIALSSTTVEIRSKILSMGAKLKVLSTKKVTPNGSSRNAETAEEFREEMLNHSAQQSRPESQGEAADLRALREANNSSTDNRPTEVEVTQQKKVQSDTKASSIPPLHVSGDDDCDLLYDILLNTCGFSVIGSYGNWQFQHDVPLLLCRSIGPCLNTVLKTLSVSACRDNMYWNQVNGTEGSGEKSSESVMELYGPILPCSLRDLMCASINWTTVDQKAEENNMFDAPTQPMNGNHNNDSENKDTSRQVTMFIQAHEGETISAASSTGSSSSSFFNNGSILGDLNEFKTRDLQWNECIEGEGLRSLVWCNSRSTELSYNTFFT